VELAITGLEKQGFEAELVDDDDDDNGALSLAYRLCFCRPHGAPYSRSAHADAALRADDELFGPEYSDEDDGAS
jgi:hypothetical protein